MLESLLTFGMPAAILLGGILTGWLFATRHRDGDSRMFVRATVSFQLPAEDVAESLPEPAELVEESAAAAPPAAAVVERPVRFIIDVMLLRQSFEYVCGRPSKSIGPGSVNGFREVFHYAAGFQVDEQTYVIAHLLPVKFSRQEAGGVRVADGSNIVVLETLDRMGLPLAAHFHSHPGFGQSANHPSNVDHRFQERLERGGHCAIGGIFSRDGYVRFFAGDLDRFVVDVIGNNVRKVGDNEFKLELADQKL